MDHTEHVALIRAGVVGAGQVWADFGSGAGAFTLALADILGPRATIWSVDRERRALQEQEAAMQARFPEVTLKTIVADFTRPLDLPPLDGIVMANSLHFLRHRDKVMLLTRLHDYLRPGGRLVLVEYDIERGNPWVPYPLTYSAWEHLARETSFTDTCLLATRPSRFLHGFYAALSLSPSERTAS